MRPKDSDYRITFYAIISIVVLLIITLITKQMKINTTVEQLDKEDYYYLKIENYKQKVEGKFSREELRHLIEVIDNAI